jgi:hypothetical protein
MGTIRVKKLAAASGFDEWLVRAVAEDRPTSEITLYSQISAVQDRFSIPFNRLRQDRKAAWVPGGEAGCAP